MLDFSHRFELRLIADVVTPVIDIAAKLHVPIMITGALARDLLMYYQFNIETSRQTEDVDIALAIEDWRTLNVLRENLIASGQFHPLGQSRHSLRHSNNLPLDLIPFGRIESSDRHVAWPPDGDFIIDMFGFREALATALDVVFPNQQCIKVVSLPALTLLKLVAWQERHLRVPKKDAHDLALIISHYLDCGNQERMWSDFSAWMDESEFDYESSGARMLGHDIKMILDRTGQIKLASILFSQIDLKSPSTLPREMNEHDAAKAHMLLTALYDGLTRR